jgi:hypothetical protein
MPAGCSAECFDFGIADGRPAETGLDGGLVTSDAGGLLLGGLHSRSVAVARIRISSCANSFSSCLR